MPNRIASCGNGCPVQKRLKRRIGIRRLPHARWATSHSLRKLPAQVLMVRLAEPNSRKPEPRAEGMRFLDHPRDFPQLALRALKNGGFFWRLMQTHNIKICDRGFHGSLAPQKRKDSPVPCRTQLPGMAFSTDRRTLRPQISPARRPAAARPATVRLPQPPRSR